MHDKLRIFEKKYEELGQLMSEPEYYSDVEAYSKIAKEQKELAPVVETYREYKKCEADIAAAKELMSEPGFEDMGEEELAALTTLLARLEEKLRILMLPKDPNDDRNVIIEIRAGVGGEESALFASNLYRMYSMYAESRSWKTEIANINETELGGIKEISFVIEGDGAYSRLKYESGVHRVQRVPETESSGRIHTSTVTVAVLPEVDIIEFEINPSDLQIDTYRASGAGGQHVNKTESAIRITHIPTGTIVECQDERSQHKNRERAMKILASRLYDAELEKQNAALAMERKSQVGSGMRNERIRTYNFPQGRVTDHRIGLTLYKLEQVMNGSVDEIIDALAAADRLERLNSVS